jgi:cation-transporting ATPase E
VSPTWWSKNADAHVVVGELFVSMAEASYVAERVGSVPSYANKLTDALRMFQVVKTPLQQQSSFCGAHGDAGGDYHQRCDFGPDDHRAIPAHPYRCRLGGVSGQVPYGLFSLVALAYATGAAGIAKRRALVQQTNAIESLSNVDVLCMDKTGTLTANRMQLHDVALAGDAGGDCACASTAIGVFARSGWAPGDATSDASTRRPCPQRL